MKNNTHDLEVEKLLKSLNIASLKPTKNDEDVDKDCLEKLKNISKKYTFYSQQRKVSENKLKNLSKELQEELEFVLSAYEKRDGIPSNVLNEFLKVSNIRFIYLEMINEKSKSQTLKELGNIKKDYKESVDKLANVNKQLDGMWGNVLAVILSFSIVAAMIEVIVKMDREWVFVFCLFIIWIGMTLLVFFSNLFENKGMGSTTSKVMYGIVILLTVISFVITVEYLPEKDSKTGEDKKVTNINDLPVISNNEH